MKRFFLAIFADGGRGPPVARKGSGTPLPGGDQHRGGKKRLERQQTKAQGTEHSARKLFDTPKTVARVAG